MTNEHYGQLFYLASPYTHKDPAVQDKRTELATEAAVDLLNNGLFCFAPIPYNAPWSKKYSLPGDWKFWCEFDKTFISRMDAVIVLMIDGFKESTGVNAEIKFAEEIKIPVFFVTQEQCKSKEFVEIILETTKNYHIEKQQKPLDFEQFIHDRNNRINLFCDKSKI